MNQKSKGRIQTHITWHQGGESYLKVGGQLIHGWNSYIINQSSKNMQ